jgi:hypothetical protein
MSKTAFPLEGLFCAVVWVVPPARFERALPPPEGGALSPELRGLKTKHDLIALGRLR